MRRLGLRSVMGAGLLAAIFGGGAVARAQPAGLLPFVDSVKMVLDDASIADAFAGNGSPRHAVASWGYASFNADPITVNPGSFNFFFPGSINRNQPRTFDPGIHHDVVTVEFNPLITWTLTWSLALKLAAAGFDANTPTYVYTGTTYTQRDTFLPPSPSGLLGSIPVDGTFATGPTQVAGTYVQTGGSFTAPTFTIVTGGVARLTAGTLNATTSLANSGTLELRGGVLATPSFSNLAGGTLAVYADYTLASFTNSGSLTGAGGNFAVPTLANPVRTDWAAGTLTVDSVTSSGVFAQTGGTVAVGAGFTNTGLLRIEGGTFSTPSLTGNGTVDLRGGTLVLTSGGLDAGGGSFLGANPIVSGGGTLRLAAGATTVGSGQTLTINSGGTLVTQGGTNSGQLNVTGGTLTSESGTFTNAAGGTLNATAATLSFGGGGLENRGVLNLVNATLNGSVHSPAGSAVNAASGVTFTGAFSGAGNFTGGGLVTFQGGYSPGDSPALVMHSGSLLLDTTNTLTMELGGLLRGTRYDALDVTGTLTFGGTLSLQLIDGFNPTTGATFNLFDWGGASGTFSALDLPALAGGLSWDTSSLYTLGEIGVMGGGSAIPEPSTYAALAAACALGFAAWRRRPARAT